MDTGLTLAQGARLRDRELPDAVYIDSAGATTIVKLTTNRTFGTRRALPFHPRN
ncbi:hypothetical protein ABTZ59_13710 [Streptomyces sp. NPDC094034]|uniref:hypothetical protein n=1 Tax=Streptomyces sp. NPDC094034 TaxID=3155309 RepID=UPI00331AA6EA